MKTLRLILSTFLLFIATIGLAQKKYSGNGEVVTTARTINDFNQLEVKGPFKVTLTSALNNKIQLTTDANLMDQIITEVNDQTLSIRLKKHTYLKPSKGKPIHIKVPLVALKSVLHAGSGKIYAEEAFRTNAIAITHSGSGKIHLSLTARNTTVVLSGSGKIELEGSTNKLITKLSGSGNIRLADFKAVEGEVRLSGSGNIDVNCNETLDAKVSGSGNVRYKGEPSKRLISKVSGSGAIRKVN